MFTVIETVDIARSPADVFAFLTDPDHRAEWDRSVLSERLLTPPPVVAGSRIRTRMQVWGRDLEFEWRVQRFDPPREMSAESDSGTMPTRMRFRFEPADGGCRVRVSLDAQPTGMLRLVEGVVSQVARGTLAEGLARAKTILEREGTARHLPS